MRSTLVGMPGPRIASLLPSATEICHLLGLGENLVGVSHECDYPQPVQALPRLTWSQIDSSASGGDIDAQVREAVAEGLSLYAVDRDALTRAAPDLVITQDTCEVCAVSKQQVVASVRDLLGPSVEVLSLQPLSLADVFDDIKRVARVAGVEARGLQEVATLEARVESLRSTRPANGPRVLFLEWLEPPMVAGHWTPELLRVAGTDPVLGHEGAPTRACEWSEIEAVEFELVVLAPCGYPLSKTKADLEAAAQRPEFDALWDRAPVWAIDGNAYFNRSGPRLVDSAEIVAALASEGRSIPGVAERIERGD